MKYEYRICKICSEEYVEEYSLDEGMAKVPICNVCTDKASWKTYRVRIPIMGYYEHVSLTKSSNEAIDNCEYHMTWSHDFYPVITGEGEPEVEVIEGYNPHKNAYERAMEDE